MRQINNQGKPVLRRLLIAAAAILMAFALTGCGAQAPTLSEVQLMTPVDKTEYMVGEKFETDGLTLIGVYSDGSRQKFTDFSFDKTGPLTKEDTVVSITAGSQTFEQPIKVITPAEKIILVPVNGVDTLEMYADGHIAVVGGAGNGSLKPEETYWTWDGETLRIWLTNYAIKASQPDQPIGGVTEDHKTEMNLVKNDVGDITFEYDIRGSWHMNYTITAASMAEALTPDVRYPITE